MTGYNSTIEVMSWESQVGRFIKLHRQNLGMRQIDLGAEMAAAGHTAWAKQAAVSLVETGGRCPRLSEAVSLARILRVNLKELCPPGL